MGSNLKILTRSLPERTTPAPSFTLVTLTSTCCLLPRSILVPLSLSGWGGRCRPACNCTQQCIQIVIGCLQGSVLCSVVHKCWTRCQDCANEVPRLCQRGAQIVQTRCQDCANELPRLHSVVPVRFSIVRG